MHQDAARARTEAMLRDLWQRKMPMVRQHLSTLDRVALTLGTAALTAPLRSEAAISAHKLAGSLGMFGYPEGTRYARELEHLLDADAAPPPDTFTAILSRLHDSLPL